MSTLVRFPTRQKGVATASLTPTWALEGNWGQKAAGESAGDRGTPGTQEQVELTDDDVVELHWQDGLVSWSTEQLLTEGATASRDAGGVLELPRTRRDSGPSRGMGAVALKAWQVLTFVVPSAEAARKKTLRKLISAADDRLSGPKPILGRIARDGPGSAMLPMGRASGGDEPWLLLVHGTFSSIPGGFAALATEEASRDWLRLWERYEGRILGFQHPTLSVGPVQNALDLVLQLPPGIRLDMMSHSRGGLVIELLAATPPEDVLAALREATDPGVKALLGELEALRDARKERRIEVERIVRVAAPLRGTRLASTRASDIVDAVGSIVNLTVEAVGTVFPQAQAATAVTKAVVNAARAIVRVASDSLLDPEITPGLSAMGPDGPLVKVLNRSLASLKERRLIVAGVYSGQQGTVGRIERSLPNAFFGGDNDLVVDTERMYAATDRAVTPAFEPTGPGIHHLRYFADRATRQTLVAWLERHESLPLALRPSSETNARGVIDVLRELPARNPKGDGRDIVVILPGIMGSTLEIAGNRVWIDVGGLTLGGFGKLDTGKGAEVTPSGVVRDYYAPLVDALDPHFDVGIFPYDWRLSLKASSARLAGLLADHLPHHRVHLIAHSMGGLVARGLAAWHPGTWQKLRAGRGRLVMMGTPNHGSYDAVAGMLGDNGLVRGLAAADIAHRLPAIARIIRSFEGLASMIPAEVHGAGPTSELWDPEIWQRLIGSDDMENTLRAGKAARAQLDAAFDPAGMFLILGTAAKTRAGLRLGAEGHTWLADDDVVGAGIGDGRVPYRLSRLAGVPEWYVGSAHGDIPKDADAIRLALQIVRGSTPARGVEREAGAAVRTRRGPSGEARTAEPLIGFPTESELTAAALGGSRIAHTRARRNLTISVTHGTLEDARFPLMIGLARQQEILGPHRRLDLALQNELTRMHVSGFLPSELGQSQAVGSPASRPPGALIVGLGDLSCLTPAGLVDTVRRAVGRHLLQLHHAAAGPKLRAGLSTLLMGGYAGLGADVGVPAIVEGVSRALEDLKAWPEATQSFAELEIVELYADSAARIASAARTLARTHRFRSELGTVWDAAPEVRIGSRQRTMRVELRQAGAVWRSLSVMRRHGLFEYVYSGGTTVAPRASVALDPEAMLPVQALATTGHDRSSPSWIFSRTLFRELFPRDLREPLQGGQPLLVQLDPAAAAIPWEMATDPDQGDEEPLVLRTGFVRTLTSSFSAPSTSSRAPHAIVLADRAGEDSGLLALPGAEKEGRAVAGALDAGGLATRLLLRDGTAPLAEQLKARLITAPCRVFHVAAHGIHQMPSRTKGSMTGIALGEHDGDYLVLTADQLLNGFGKDLPELIFLNCCHLGQQGEDPKLMSGAGRARLAASVSKAFIKRGVRAVIAAGWAVDDDAATVFARTFYDELLAGVPFGEAVRLARRATWSHAPQLNTWGAYQAWGDPTWTLLAPTEAWRADETRPFHVAMEVLEALEEVRYEVSQTEGKKPWMEHLLPFDKRIPTWLRTSAVLGALGEAWGAAGDYQRAIDCLYDALRQEKADLTLMQIEQLANFEARRAGELAERAAASKTPDGDAEKADRDQAATLLASSEHRLEWLLDLADTAERRSLLGSTMSRAADAFGGAKGEVLRGRACKAYREAGDIWLRVCGKRHFYPEHNYALLTLLTSGPDAELGFLDDLLRVAVEDLPYWQAKLADVWIRVAPADLLLSRFLVELQRTKEPIEGAQARVEGIAGEFHRVLRANTEPQEIDSVRKSITSLQRRLDTHAPTRDLARIVESVLAALGKLEEEQ